MKEINKKLNFKEVKSLANYLFPIGSVISVNIGDQNKCPAIILGYLICKNGLGDSMKYLGRQELEFTNACRLIVLRGKQKLVCCFGSNNNIWTTKADEYDQEYWDGWEELFRRDDFSPKIIAQHF